MNCSKSWKKALPIKFVIHNLQLLGNFDEDVHDQLKTALIEAEERLDKLGRWFWGVTHFALEKRAKFDAASYAFSL